MAILFTTPLRCELTQSKGRAAGAIIEISFLIFLLPVLRNVLSDFEQGKKESIATKSIAPDPCIGKGKNGDNHSTTLGAIGRTTKGASYWACGCYQMTQRRIGHQMPNPHFGNRAVALARGDLQ